MSESSPFRTPNNGHYMWPPETISSKFRKKYERVTHVISNGEPKEWMKAYVASNISEFLTQNGARIITYLATSHGELPEAFELDQEWWNDKLNRAYELDLNTEQKREDFDLGVSHLKYKPSKPIKVATLLKLDPAEKFKKYLKEYGADNHRDSAATRGTEVHRIAEELGKGNETDFDPTLTGFVENAQLFLDQYEPKFIEIESVVYSDRFGYAGQFDWLADIPMEVMERQLVWNRDTKQYEPWTDKRSDARKLESPNYVRVWGDYKTGDKGIKDSIALQLAAYQYADFIGREDGTKSEVPKADEYWGVSIRNDALQVVPVRVDQSVFEAFLAVRATGIWKTETARKILNRPLQEIAA